MTSEEKEHKKTGARIARARPRPTNGVRATELGPEAIRTRNAFFANLRHELRTPLNAVIGYSEMLLEDAEDTGPDADPVVPDLKKIHSAGNELLRRVNDILDPAKIQAGEIETDLESFGRRLRHELHTPVDALISYSEMLLEDAMGNGATSCFIQSGISDLRKICIAGKRFLAMINDVLNFPKLSKGIMIADMSTPDASATIQNTAEDIPPMRTGKPAEITGEKGRLLVVDDSEMNRDLLFQRLKRQGYMPFMVENGLQALEMIRSHPFDLILLDIMMPEMNGYQVLSHLKNDDALRDIPVIMISALDQMDSVVRCIEMGAEDYLPKPFDPVLLKARIGAALEKKRLRDKEQLYAKSLEREMEIGREIQTSFFPEFMPQAPGWEIAARFHPARQVSGDFYDTFLLPQGEDMGIVIADVCDKGVGAALFMGLFRSLIRAFADICHAENLASLVKARETETNAPMTIRHEQTLKTVISLTNDYIAKNHSKANMFATIFFGVIGLETGKLTYINGGHEPPVIMRSGGERAYLRPTGPAVGMMPEMPFETGEADIRPGDMLLTFTDGITEALGPTGELYGKERLVMLLSDTEVSADAMLDRIEDSLRRHTAGADQSDDITLLAVRRS